MTLIKEDDLDENLDDVAEKALKLCKTDLGLVPD